MAAMDPPTAVRLQVINVCELSAMILKFAGEDAIKALARVKVSFG